jgi:hypothetical protein
MNTARVVVSESLVAAGVRARRGLNDPEPRPAYQAPAVQLASTKTAPCRTVRHQGFDTTFNRLGDDASPAVQR